MLALGYNTNGFAHHALDDALDVIAGLGYSGVGLTLDVHHLNPLRATPAEVAAVARRLGTLGLRCAVETGARYILDPRRKHEPSLVSADPEGRARRLDLLLRSVDIAADLGAEAIALFSGRRDPAQGDEGEAWRRLEWGVSRVLDRAVARGVRVGFEPEPGHMVDTLEKYERLEDALGLDLGLTLDLGHVPCAETFSIVEAVSRYAGRAVNVHIEDIRDRAHEHLPFGEGDIDFSPVLDALETQGYRGLVTVELSRHSHDAPEQARRAFEFLTRVRA